MNATAGGLAGIGFVVAGLGLVSMFLWKNDWPKTNCWLMLIGGVCLAAGGFAPLLKAGTIVSSGASSAAGLFGIGAGAVIALLGLVLIIHVGRALYPDSKQKKPVSPNKGHQLSALFAPVFVAIAGGVVAFGASVFAIGSTAVTQLATFLGS